MTYSTLLSNKTEDELTSIIKGIIEGETRVLTANLSLDEIFRGRDEFREAVTKRVDVELGRLGLCIHNANIQVFFELTLFSDCTILRDSARFCTVLHY